ncbi:MAG: hypothetical protein OER86_12190 [Phycisphaerae bacterium]|nr:hypothetical protein [Phycisphaerae bacterium]
MAHAPRARRIRRVVFFSAGSVLACAAVAVLLAVVFSEDLVRHGFMRMLCSSDPAKQQRAVAWLVSHAAEPEVRAHAERVLPDVDDACFERMIAALQVAGVWGPSFGDGWIRYLLTQARHAEAIERSRVAAELARRFWRESSAPPSSVGQAATKLLEDVDAAVRLNALSLVACLDDPKRRDLLARATADAEPAVARRAWILVGLLAGPGQSPPSRPASADEMTRPAIEFALSRFGTVPPRPAPTGPPADASAVVKELARLEALPTASVDAATLSSETPDLIRLHAVRVSKSALPGDLLPVFRSAGASLRDLACHVARERFTDQECRDLAEALISSFHDEHRMGGAILAGMTPADEKLIRWLKVRVEQENLPWKVVQHYHLALAMQGMARDGFDPEKLLLTRNISRATVVMAMLHVGRREGLDWLLDPLGSPPMRLDLLLDALRFWSILRRYVPKVPTFHPWAGETVQRFEVEVIREWYLLHRRRLQFDAEKRIFGAPNP